MKRSSLNSHRQYNPVDEEARARLKHQNLLQEYSELQKEFVSMKKKWQMVNQKRETLLAEVRFLRQRYNYLSMTKSQLPDSDPSQNPYLQSRIAKNYDINEAVERRACSLPDLDQNVVHEEGSGRSQVDVQVPLRKEKKPKNGVISGKRVGKKKISWQDQAALKV